MPMLKPHPAQRQKHATPKAVARCGIPDSMPHGYGRSHAYRYSPSLASPLWGSRHGSEDIHLRLQAFAETQIIGANLEPTLRSLIKIQASPNFDDPAIIQPDLAVVEIRIQPDI